jgi:hypothetical protein
MLHLQANGTDPIVDSDLQLLLANIEPLLQSRNAAVSYLIQLLCYVFILTDDLFLEGDNGGYSFVLLSRSQ